MVSKVQAQTAALRQHNRHVHLSRVRVLQVVSETTEEQGRTDEMSDEKLVSSPADQWRIMFRPLGSNAPVAWVRESLYMRWLTAALARAEKAEAERDAAFAQLNQEQEWQKNVLLADNKVIMRLEREADRLERAIAKAEEERDQLRSEVARKERQIEALLEHGAHEQCDYCEVASECARDAIAKQTTCKDFLRKWIETID